MLNSPGRFCLFVILLLLSARFALAEDKTLDVIALGGDSYYWIGEVSKASDPKAPAVTRLSYRAYGSGQQWRPYTTVSAPLRDLAPRGDQLAAMLDTGEWVLVWPTGQSQGARPPAGKLLTMAGDGTTLWGIARVPGGAKAIPTQPATHPTTAVATSQPGLPERLVLLRLDRSDWMPVADLPENLQIAAGSARAHMAMSGNAPVVAVQDGEKAVRVARFTRQHVWLDEVRIESSSLVKEFALLSAPTRTLLWVADAGGAGSLSPIDPATMGLKPLESSRPILPGAARTATIASERLRVLFSDADDLYEQQYDLDGRPLGQAFAVKVPQITAASPMQYYISAIMMGALMFTIVSAIRQRPAIQQTLESAAELPLASFGLRLGAGIVDAFAVVAMLVVIVNRAQTMDAVWQVDSKFFVPYFISIAITIAHTTVGELIYGRSIGKMLFGLKVTNLEGQAASAKAILIRNLLRIVDFGLWGIPLVLVLYSPLRQRAGDVAAGTLVLRQPKSTPPST
jgi:uncharacterized RDD family membrane protein YckC